MNEHEIHKLEMKASQDDRRDELRLVDKQAAAKILQRARKIAVLEEQIREVMRDE